MKAFVIRGLGLVGLCSQLMGHTMEERLNNLEMQMEEIGSMNSSGTFGVDFTSASPNTINDWLISIEPLYWHAKVGGTEYAYTDEELNITSGILHPPINGRIKYNEFGWNWGLRVGLGHIFPQDEWNLYLSYTWWQTSDSDSVTKNAPSVILPIRQAELYPARVVKSHFNLDYNNINLELGRHYFMSSKTSVHPYIGLKSTWIYEKQNIRMNQTLIDFGPGPGRDLKTRDKTVLWGIGPRLGIDAEGYIGDGFSLYAKVAGALLYGYSQTSYHQTADNEATAAGANQRISFRGKNHLFIPTAQMMLGLIWKTYVNNQRQHVTIGAGYEVEYYWRANQMFMVEDTAALSAPNLGRRIQLDRISEDVMFYGLTLKACLNF